MTLTSLVNDVKNYVNLYVPALAHQAPHGKRTRWSITFLLHVNPHISWHKIPVFEKKMYDVINKVYTFQFENLTIFIAFPLPSMETGTKFHVFQSDLAPKRSW